MSRFLLLALALIIAFVSAMPTDEAKKLDDTSAVDLVSQALSGEEAGCAAATCAAATSGTPAARSNCNLCTASSQCMWQWSSTMDKKPLTTCGTGASGNAADLGTCICKAGTKKVVQAKAN
jgi:hypothetical protein